MPGPDCRKSPEPTAVFADDQFYLQRMKEILQSASLGVVNGSTSVESNAVTLSQLRPVQLLDHVFIGSQRNADSVELLRRHGITHVLNCAGLRRYDFTRSPYPKDSGIKGFLMISAEDSEDYDIKRHFSDAIAFLNDVKRTRGRSLVHCNLGVNRSGAVVAAYLMVSERRTLLDIMQYLRSKRSLILSNKGFRRQLVTFARERGLLDPVITDTDKAGENSVSKSLPVSSHNGGLSSRTTPSVVVSDLTDHSLQSTSDSDDGRRYWTTQQAAGNWLLSPVFEQRQSDGPSSSGGVLSGFLTLLGGAGGARRRPLRSTSFSNVSSCTAASNASTSTTWTAFGTSAASTPSTTLSTARPLRVYTRSSTDTELYRRRPPVRHAVVRQQFSENHGRPSD